MLHPIGWDAFGLPAEQYAIQTGTHPRVTTERNINRFRQQLQSLGGISCSPAARRTARLLVQYRGYQTALCPSRLLLRLGPRGVDHRPGVLPLDAVDLPAALQARARVPGGGARQLVPRAGHGAGQRGGHRRQERARRPPRRAPAHEAGEKLPAAARPLRAWCTCAAACTMEMRCRCVLLPGASGCCASRATRTGC